MTTDCPILAPTRFTVDNCRLAGLSTSESKVFVADVTAYNWTGAQQVFKRVFFVESAEGSAWIAGCDIESLTVRHPREAAVQVELFRYLRLNNLQEQERFGMVLTPATARESSEARVTQAYLEARDLQSNIRIGYCDCHDLFRVAILMPSPQQPQAAQRGLRLVGSA
jgi:hypothetical protein